MEERGSEGDLVHRRGVESGERPLEASEVGLKRGRAVAQYVLVGGVSRDERIGRLPQLPGRLGRGRGIRLEAARIAVA